MQRSLAQKFSDRAAARLLRFAGICTFLAAALHVLATLGFYYIFSTGLSRTRPPLWLTWLLSLLAIPTILCSLLAFWAQVRFALGLSRAVRFNRSNLRPKKTILSITAATALGAAGGLLLQYIFRIQVDKAQLGWTPVVWGIHYILLPLAMLIAAATLPPSLQQTTRTLRRSRH